uniref:Uncharacterized protein n=1 Tax=Chenopodium quinoa TaxID=63459 RepID=A0A803MDG4_CHEQI
MLDILPLKIVDIQKSDSVHLTCSCTANCMGSQQLKAVHCYPLQVVVLWNLIILCGPFQRVSRPILERYLLLLLRQHSCQQLLSSLLPCNLHA